MIRTKLHDNGKVKSEVEYHNKVKDGLSKEYDFDEKLILVSNYKNGKLHGKWTEYSSNGNIINIKYFYEDEEVNEIQYYSKKKMEKLQKNLIDKI